MVLISSGATGSCSAHLGDLVHANRIILLLLCRRRKIQISKIANEGKMNENTRRKFDKKCSLVSELRAAISRPHLTLVYVRRKSFKITCTQHARARGLRILRVASVESTRRRDPTQFTTLDLALFHCFIFCVSAFLHSEGSRESWHQSQLLFREDFSPQSSLLPSQARWALAYRCPKTLGAWLFGSRLHRTSLPSAQGHRVRAYP